MNSSVRTLLHKSFNVAGYAQVAKFMGPTWSPPGSCRPQIGSMLDTWTLQSGYVSKCRSILSLCDTTELIHNGNHIIPSYSSNFHLYLHFHSRHAYYVFKSTPPSHVYPNPSHTRTNILFVQISKVWDYTGLTKTTPHLGWRARNNQAKVNKLVYIKMYLRS